MQTDLLTQLKDIHLPAPIHFWPPASGWIILMVFFIIGLLIAAYYLWRYFLRKRKMRYLLEKLNTLMDNESVPNLLEQLNIYLKQLALSLYQRERTAALTGKSWLAFLDATGNTQDFTQGCGRILLTGPYEKFPQADLHALKRLITKWIEINV